MALDNVGKLFLKAGEKDGSCLGVLGFASSVPCRFVAVVGSSSPPGTLNSSGLALSA